MPLVSWSTRAQVPSNTWITTSMDQHSGGGFPIHVDVPSKQIMLGAGGQAGAGTITTLAQAAKDQDLSGIMVWYSSVIDTATGKVGNQYSGGSMDSSIQGAESKAAWEKACEIMLGGPCNPSSAEELIA